MVARVIAVEPFNAIVFGATGDLAGRKLIPALYHRFADGQMPPEARVLGVSRRKMSDDQFRQVARDSLMAHVSKTNFDPAKVDQFLSGVSYLSAQADSEEGWPELAQAVRQPGRIRMFYLATGPELFVPICERLGRYDMVGDRSRIVVEKPIGKSLESARKVNAEIGKVFPEDRVYRIDHYLGKETVQNLMALRFANGLFEPLWNAAHIDHVQITVAETLGVEGRAGYYDTAGALRDMVQNHILQLLCLVAMEPPTSIQADSVRDEKLKVLKALVPIVDGQASEKTVRGQYRAGASAGGPVPGYLEELGRNTSPTETFVAIHAEIANWRWAGVPFYLRTGKRLAERVSEIVVAFRPIPHSVFDGTAGRIVANRLVIRVQPDEGVNLWLMIKDPGPGGMRLQYAPLDMSFAKTFGVRNPDAYERLLMDTVRGNPDAVHASGRGGGGVELDRPDPGCLERIQGGAEAIHFRHVGTLGGGRAGGAQRSYVARGHGVGNAALSIGNAASGASASTLRHGRHCPVVAAPVRAGKRLKRIDDRRVSIRSSRRAPAPGPRSSRPRIGLAGCAPCAIWGFLRRYGSADSSREKSMRNLVFAAAAGLALTACQNAQTMPAPTTNESAGSSQGPSMAPAPQLGGIQIPNSQAPTTPSGGQAPSMAPVTGGPGVTAPNSDVMNQSGQVGQSPSMSGDSSGPALKRASGQNPTVVPLPTQSP